MIIEPLLVLTAVRIALRAAFHALGTTSMHPVPQHAVRLRLQALDLAVGATLFLCLVVAGLYVRNLQLPV